MKKRLLTLTLLTCSWVAVPAWAQTTPAPSRPAMVTNDSLYQALGKTPGLLRLMDDFMLRLLADPRTGPHFKPANQERVKTQLVAQFCMVSGGPCVYKGADMKSVHSNLDISKADFHALVEVLQLSMEARGIAFSVQNRLLAQLAPMHRDVITIAD